MNIHLAQLYIVLFPVVLQHFFSYLNTVREIAHELSHVYSTLSDL